MAWFDNGATWYSDSEASFVADINARVCFRYGSSLIWVSYRTLFGWMASTLSIL